jgi:hypothetical protein
VIIETGAFERAIVEAKTEWLDQMQTAACIGAQAYNISRVGGDLRLKQSDAEQRC